MADYQLRQTGATIQDAIDIALRVLDELAAEAAAREAADALLASKTELQAEAARAQAAEALLATIASLNSEIERATGVEDALQSLIDAIEERIPSAASTSNQLADKAFVNSSIATATAKFRGTYNSLAELQAVSADENDYGFVRTTDAAGNTVFKRYKYASGSWVWEYDLNNSSFTASQWAAINSAITAELVEKLRALPTNAALTELLNGKQGVIADLDTIRSNAAAGVSAYQKPSGGIPASDMADGVIPDIADNLTTNDATNVLSAKQGKVLNENLIQLEQKLTNNKTGYADESALLSLTWEGGYRTTSGVTGQYGVFHTEFNAKKGMKLVVTMPAALVSSTPALLKKNQDNSYSNLLTFDAPWYSYTYVVPEDMTICANFRNGAIAFDGTGFSVMLLSVYSILAPVKEDVDTLKTGKVGYTDYNKAGGLVWEGGYRTTSGVTGQYGVFHTEFNAKKGDVIRVTMPMYLSRTIPAILKKTGDNTYTPVLTMSASYNGYEYKVSEDAILCANFRNGAIAFDGTGFLFYTPSLYAILEENNKGNARLNVGKNLLDPSKIKSGYYLTSSGAETANSSYSISDYIPFTGGKIIMSVDGKVPVTVGASYVLYNSDKQVVSSYTISELAGEPVPWEEGVAFVRFSIPVSSLENREVQVELGTYPTRYVPYGNYVPQSVIEPGNNLTTRFGHLYDSGELGEGESLTLPVTYVRNNLVLSAIVKGAIEEIQLGQGDGVYNGGSITITATTITLSGVSYAHSLTLTGRTAIFMNRGDGKVVIVSGSGGKYEHEFSSSMGGAPFLKNKGQTSIEVELSFFPKNITKKVWLIGDSYMGTATTRWPHWMLDWAGDNVMIDNLPGGNSTNMMAAFLTDLSIGQPEYALWGLGMNDGTDTTESNFTSWKRFVMQFITLCLARNITPVLATIPSVPSTNNESKNAWVKASGFRFIDFAKAVNAQADGTWDAGLLSSDNIHPTEEGAKVLASQVLIDFPEIAYQ